MKKIRLVHVQLLPILSGVQNVSMQIFSNIDLNIFDLYLICSTDHKGNRDLIIEAEKIGVKVITINSLKRNISFFDVLAFFELISIFRRYKFDIIHTHSSKTGFLGRICGKISGCKKIIHTVHGLPFHDYQNSFIRSAYKILERFASYFSDYIVFVNNSERELCINEHIVNNEQSLTIYNGINIYLDNNRVNTDLNNLFFGSVSRFSEQKNIINTIKTAIYICINYSNVKFEFIGDGDLYSICSSMVKSAGLEHRILLPGWDNNIYDHLLQYDLFILYSKWEGLPLAILEAMSCSLPIVASDIKGNNELVDFKNGYLVDVSDNIHLQSILSEICENPNELLDKGRNSLLKVKDNFTFENFIDEYNKLYLS